MNSTFTFSLLLAVLAVAASSLTTPATASADDIFVAEASINTIGEYTASGAVINASLIAVPHAPLGLAASGNDLFVVESNGTIGEYTTSGATVNASLVTGLPGLMGIAVSGGNLFVTDYDRSGLQAGVGEYTTSGATVNESVVRGLSNPSGIVVSGNDMFIASTNSAAPLTEYTTSGTFVNSWPVPGPSVGGVALLGNDLFITENNSRIGEYTTLGATVNASLITGLSVPTAVAASQGDVLVGNTGSGAGAGTVGEYDATTGTAVNAALITGLTQPSAIVVVTPEPSTWIMFAIGAAGLSAAGLRTRRAPALPSSSR